MTPSPLNLLSHFRAHTDSYNLTLAVVEANAANAGGRQKARQLPVRPRQAPGSSGEA